MTTKEAAARYLMEHQMEVMGRKVAVFNPKDLDIGELPVIFGFNNGGRPGWFEAVLIAEDGNCLGGHICSDEGYMPNDLGILEGTRSDRHETFQKHYPDGYRMEFVSSEEVKGHVGLQKAFDINKAIGAKEEE